MSMDHILSAAQQSADSPFIEGTQIQFAWDSVSLSSIMACARRYQYQIIWGLTPNSPNYAIALVFGILFHKGLEEYHKARVLQDHDAAVLTTVSSLLSNPATATLPVDEDIANMAESAADDDDGMTFRNSKIRTRYYLIRAVVWYLEHYRDDPCTTIILPSGAPAVEVSFRVPLPIDITLGPGHGYASQKTQLLLCGHIDRGVEFNGFLYSGDYKTTKSITSQWRQLFELSHQMTGYTIAGKIIWDRPVRGALIDGVALQVGQVKFNRHFTDRTDGQLVEYTETLREAAHRAVRYAEADHYPLEGTMSGACFLCEYKDICSQPPEYRAGYIKGHYTRRPGWNPLENR